MTVEEDRLTIEVETAASDGESVTRTLVWRRAQSPLSEKNTSAVTFIVLSGLPGSGKSTLAKAFASGLAVDVLDKDDILDGLFDSRGIGDSDWRSALSREADEHFANEARRRDSACLVSWWRDPLANARSGTPTAWLAALPGAVVEVHCVCQAEVAADRFLARRRHPGHLDAMRTRESLVNQLAAARSPRPTGMRPCAPGHDRSRVDIDACLAWIRAAVDT